MTLPALVFGFLISTLYGALFHLWRGGGFIRLLLYLTLGWVGFWIGHVVALQAGWTFASLGSLRLGPATISSVIFLSIGHWLSLVQVQRK